MLIQSVGLTEADNEVGNRIIPASVYGWPLQLQPPRPRAVTRHVPPPQKTFCWYNSNL